MRDPLPTSATGFAFAGFTSGARDFFKGGLEREGRVWRETDGWTCFPSNVEVCRGDSVEGDRQNIYETWKEKKIAGKSMSIRKGVFDLLKL